MELDHTGFKTFVKPTAEQATADKVGLSHTVAFVLR